MIIAILRRKKRRRMIKTLWMANTRLRENQYESYKERLEDVEAFAEAMAEVASELGILDVRPPCYWED